MIWFASVLSAYALLAAVAVGDKFLLARRLPDPALYAFLVGLLGSLAVLLSPWLGFPVPDPAGLGLAVLSGILFVLASYFLYIGLRREEVSRFIPAVGGLVAVFTLMFAAGLSLRTVSPLGREVWALLILVAGSLELSARRGKAAVAYVISAAAFFGLSFATAKAAFLVQSFWSGFLWMRLGGGLAAVLLFLALPGLRRGIREGFKRPPAAPGTPLLFVGNQALGALGIVLQNFAVYLVPALYLPFVNALQGVQYVFLILFAAILGRQVPDLAEEGGQELVRRVVGILLVALGLLLLAFTLQ